jgi:hypothetical protein
LPVGRRTPLPRRRRRTLPCGSVARRPLAWLAMGQPQEGSGPEDESLARAVLVLGLFGILVLLAILVGRRQHPVPGGRLGRQKRASRQGLRQSPRHSLHGARQGSPGRRLQRLLSQVGGSTGAHAPPEAARLFAATGAEQFPLVFYATSVLPMSV